MSICRLVEALVIKFKHDAMVECRREIIESLPHPQGDEESEAFTRTISALILRLLATSREPERVWASNFTHSLRCSMRTMSRPRWSSDHIMLCKVFTPHIVV